VRHGAHDERVSLESFDIEADLDQQLPVFLESSKGAGSFWKSPSSWVARLAPGFWRGANSGGGKQLMHSFAFSSSFAAKTI
jgi:hypothetical protein